MWHYPFNDLINIIILIIVIRPSEWLSNWPPLQPNGEEEDEDEDKDEGGRGEREGGDNDSDDLIKDTSPTYKYWRHIVTRSAASKRCVD